MKRAFPGGSGKESACQRAFDPWVRKIPGSGRSLEKEMATSGTPVFLPGKSHGQRSLASYSPWSLKRVGHDLATEQLIFFAIGVLVCLFIYSPMPFGLLVIIAFGYYKVSCKKSLCKIFGMEISYHFLGMYI